MRKATCFLDSLPVQESREVGGAMLAAAEARARMNGSSEEESFTEILFEMKEAGLLGEDLELVSPPPRWRSLMDFIGGLS